MPHLVENVRSAKQMSFGLIYCHFQNILNLKLINYFVTFSKLHKSQSTNSRSLSLKGFHSKGQISASCWKHTLLKTNSECFSLGTIFSNTFWNFCRQKSMNMDSAQKKWTFREWGSQPTSSRRSPSSHFGIIAMRGKNKKNQSSAYQNIQGIPQPACSRNLLRTSTSDDLVGSYYFDPTKPGSFGGLHSRLKN